MTHATPSTSQRKEQVPRQGKAKTSAQKSNTASWKEQLTTLWESPYRKPAMKKLWQLLGELCVYFKPHTFRFRLKIGQADPAATGMLIAKLTMMYPLIYRYGSIEGIYEYQGVEGFVEVAGRVRLYRLSGIILKFIIDKNVRSYSKMIMNIRKVKTNGI